LSILRPKNVDSKLAKSKAVPKKSPKRYSPNLQHLANLNRTARMPDPLNMVQLKSLNLELTTPVLDRKVNGNQ
jgi:hypothetical protein